MNGSNQAIAINRCFAIGKRRDIVRKAKSNHYATLHAHATHALYLLCGSLRPLLDAVITAHRIDHTLPWRTWTSMHPCCSTVRRRSPAVVVAK
jgi:hypothetical protein